MEETDIKETGNEQYFQKFAKRLEKINKEDLIKLFLSHKFSRILDDYKNARDLNAKAKPSRERRGGGDDISLKINFGRKHGFDIKGLFALVNSNKNLKGVEIGKINLMPEYSIFSVDKKRADNVIKFLKGTNFRAKKIVISKSNVTMASGYQGKKRGGYNRGFKEKRRGFRKK